MNIIKTISERTIERDLDRGVRFLRTLSLSPEIYTLLVSGAGYSPEEHERGWSLARALMGQKADMQAIKVAPSSPLRPAEIALAQLDAYDAPAISRSKAALEAPFPEQNQYLTSGLKGETGGRAIGSTQTFLDRYRALKDGTDPERESSREQDREAMALLERRNIVNDAIEAKLRDAIAQTAEAPEEVVAQPSPKDTEAYHQAAYDFHVWLKDWREQARAVIQRRDYLIRLGLAARRSAVVDSAEEIEDVDPESDDDDNEAPTS